MILVVDAIGKPPSGILGGNFKWLGSFDECVDVKAAINKSGEITYPWKGQYCTAHFGLKHVGKVCMLYNIMIEPPGNTVTRSCR